MAKLFFSYSHRDEAFRDELEKHLAMLKRRGLIEPWHDRRITPGAPLDTAIDQHVEAADIILLLVSSDFLNSDYCYDVEVRRAMERHELGAATVIPVILRPCDWKSAPFGHLLAVPRDGKAVTTWSNQDEAFLSITGGIKAALRSRSGNPGPSRRQAPRGEMTPPRSGPRAGSIRIPRTFSERDRDQFLEEAFEHVANFFENSLMDLERENPGIQTRYRRLDANRFTAVIYRDGRAAARCTIWMGGRRTSVGGIGYVEDDSGDTNSFNESLSVEADDQALALKPLGMAFVGQGDRRDGPLTMDAAAEYLWGLLMRRLQEGR